MFYAAKAGIAVANACPEALAAAIKRCFEDEDYYNVLKENAEAMRDKIIGVSEYCDIVISKYQDLIKQR